MKKDDIKLKYIIGLYKDLPGYPTLEDFLYIVNRWYYLDGGKEHIHGFMKIDDIGKVIFSNKHLSTLFDNEKLSEATIKYELASGNIVEFKKTAHTTYYSIETNKNN